MDGSSANTRLSRNRLQLTTFPSTSILLHCSLTDPSTFQLPPRYIHSTTIITFPVETPHLPLHTHVHLAPVGLVTLVEPSAKSEEREQSASPASPSRRGWWWETETDRGRSRPERQSDREFGFQDSLLEGLVWNSTRGKEEKEVE